MTPVRRLRLMLIGLALAVGAAMAFNVLVNPWGAWRLRLVPGEYRRVREEREVTPYLLRTSAPETLLLGSSRVLFGMKIEQGVKDGFQNGAMAGSHLPEIAKEVDIALRNPHLKRVIWGVEFYLFDSYSDVCVHDTCARLDGDLSIMITDNLLSYETLKASYRMMYRALAGTISTQAAQPIPWPGPYICGQFANPPPPTLAGLAPAHRLREVADLPEYRHFEYSPRLEQSFLDIVERIQASHAQLIVFVPPLSGYELEMIRQIGRWPEFQNWKRFLAGHLSYTDFSGYNAIARSDRMFMDAWHMEPAVGATILRMTLGAPLPDCPDAGVVANSALQVSARNVDQVLALQERRKDEVIARPNVYSATVAAAIIKRYGRLNADRTGPDLSASR
jgi:hypothetical protein